MLYLNEGVREEREEGVGAYVCVCMYFRMCVCMYAYACVCTYAYVCVCMYAYVCYVCTRMCVCVVFSYRVYDIHVLMYMCIYICIQVHTHRYERQLSREWGAGSCEFMWLPVGMSTRYSLKPEP